MRNVKWNTKNEHFYFLLFLWKWEQQDLQGAEELHQLLPSNWIIVLNADVWLCFKEKPPLSPELLSKMNYVTDIVANVH